MKNKRNQSLENTLVIADGAFYAPNLIRCGDEWMGIPPQWLHLVPDRHKLQRVKIVIHLEYRQGDSDGETQE